MQIKKSKESNSRLKFILLALFVGVFLFFCFGGVGMSSTEEYLNDLLRESTLSLSSSTNNHQAEIDAAVAAALANEKYLRQVEIDIAVKAALEKQKEEFQKNGQSSSSAATNLKKFRDVAGPIGTDKVKGYETFQNCLEDPTTCANPKHDKEECRPYGHFYDTIYDKYLAPYIQGNNEPMQFLEIGYYKGKGFQTYTEFLTKANTNIELHSMEISCLEHGPQAEGKWPYDNFAKEHPTYQSLRDANRLHCGDANKYDFLKGTWDTYMKRPDAPPLKVVIDDASHLAQHMATSLFFWFPRIEPGGILVMEDIQPTNEADGFRTHILPQVMKDLHWCGGTSEAIRKDTRCFPTIQPLLQGVHCEMHICVFIRNNKPAVELSKEDSLTPKSAFFATPPPCLFGPH